MRPLVQVSVVAYDSYTIVEKGFGGKNRTVGQGRVLGKAWDTTLGGRHLDRAIVNYVADAFNAAHGSKLPESAGGDVRRITSAMSKLRKAVVRTKEILSANEEYTMIVESVLPDVDFKTQLSRR
ncbi:hypothetical protein EON67_01195, partial [archaeon]